MTEIRRAAQQKRGTYRRFLDDLSLNYPEAWRLRLDLLILINLALALLAGFAILVAAPAWLEESIRYSEGLRIAMIGERLGSIVSCVAIALGCIWLAPIMLGFGSDRFSTFGATRKVSALRILACLATLLFWPSLTMIAPVANVLRDRQSGMEVGSIDGKLRLHPGEQDVLFLSDDVSNGLDDQTLAQIRARHFPESDESEWNKKWLLWTLSSFCEDEFGQVPLSIGTECRERILQLRVERRIWSIENTEQDPDVKSLKMRLEGLLPLESRPLPASFSEIRNLTTAIQEAQRDRERSAVRRGDLFLALNENASTLPGISGDANTPAHASQQLSSEAVEAAASANTGDAQRQLRRAERELRLTRNKIQNALKELEEIEERIVGDELQEPENASENPQIARARITQRLFSLIEEYAKIEERSEQVAGLSNGELGQAAGAASGPRMAASSAIDPLKPERELRSELAPAVGRISWGLIATVFLSVLLVALQYVRFVEAIFALLCAVAWLAIVLLAVSWGGLWIGTMAFLLVGAALCIVFFGLGYVIRGSAPAAILLTLVVVWTVLCMAVAVSGITNPEAPVSMEARSELATLIINGGQFMLISLAILLFATIILNRLHLAPARS